MASSRWLLVCSALLVGATLAARQRMVGAPEEASANDEGVRRALQFAVSEFNRGSNDKYLSRVITVEHVRKQVVSGMNYFIEAKVGRTTCTKSATNLENCPFHEAPELAKQLTCNFVVYVVPWINHISVTRSNCH